LQDLADQFVRVRLTRVDDLDLNLFDFDYDLTFAVFFLNAEEKVYARYGGRDGTSPDSRQSLAGLHYTMDSVLQLHACMEKAFAPKSQQTRKFIRDVASNRRMRGCMHCHQVREVLNAELQAQGKWSRDLIWRYPLPEVVGLNLEVDRGNMVKSVIAKSPASAMGLMTGDVVKRIDGVPIHSQADVQFALDRAPRSGAVETVWQRGDLVLTDKLGLPENWRKSDISWRPSMRRQVPAARVYGEDLTEEEKKKLELSAKQLAFRQRDSLSAQAEAAGIRAGDIILGVDGQVLEMDAFGFLRYVRGHYLIGDQVTVNVLRDGMRLNLPMTLRR
jgi:predicted metalloprotease with PDZ domain